MFARSAMSPDGRAALVRLLWRLGRLAAAGRTMSSVADLTTAGNAAVAVAGSTPRPTSHSCDASTWSRRGVTSLAASEYDLSLFRLRSG